MGNLECVITVRLKPDTTVARQRFRIPRARI